LGLRLDPAKGAYSAPLDPLARFHGSASKGKGGEGQDIGGEGMELPKWGRKERGEYAAYF